MIKIKLIVLGLFFLMADFCYSQNFGGNSPSIKWNQINTSKVKVIYPPGLDSQASRIANVLQLMDSSTTKTIGGKLRKWNIVLQNQTTIPNAYVRMAPVMSELYMTPSQDNFSTGSIRWDDNLLTHESRHIQQFSNFNKGVSRLFSFFLGQEGQLFANGLFLPDYFFEGDATFQETLVSAQGRGRMPSFFNGFKSLWLEKKNYRWMKYRSGSLKDFVPDHYAIGYILIAYGYEKYGEDFWNKVTTDALKLKGLFNDAVARHSGVSFKQFREDAINYFKEESFPIKKGFKVTYSLNFITSSKKNNVIDYQFPYFISDDSILVSKNSYKEIPAFYFITNGKEKKIRAKNYTIDDYYSYRNGKVVYASYQSDARRGNRDYSVIQLLNIHSNHQRQITFKSKYFSPDISNDCSEILAVNVKPDGTNNLHRLQSENGLIKSVIPNPLNYFFTQTKYINSTHAVSAVRNPDGKMALVKININTGETEPITPFSYNVIGYPFIKGDTILFTAMNNNSDKIFAVTLNGNKLFRLSENLIGVYYPVVNSKNELLFSSFTSGGYRLTKSNIEKMEWQSITASDFAGVPEMFTASALKKSGAGVLYTLQEKKFKAEKYRKGLNVFNFHSWRPVVDDPEFGYEIYSDNILSNFSNIVGYTYNRGDKSHTLKINSAYAAWLPVLNVGAEQSFNRTVDTALGKSVQFNSATLKTGFSIPLSFVGNRNSRFLNFGAGYNIEQYYYKGVSKNVFNNKAINYFNAFLSFSNVRLKAKQHINPRWAQTISASYRDAFTFRDSYKFVGAASLYFPGLGVNHSLVLNAAFQKRDTLPDLFSKTFSFARGYEALSTRRMYKLGVNYHFPIVYPDWGIPGLIYFLRLRANAFYDYNNAKARVNGNLTEILNRSVGAEFYFDTRVWNSLPVNFGIRFTRLLDTDLLNPAVKNRWEFIVPLNLIPD